MKFKIGDRVRLNRNKKEFYYLRGGVSYDEIGTIEKIDMLSIFQVIVVGMERKTN